MWGPGMWDMWNRPFLADNQTYSYESGASRLANSIFMAICFAPLLLIALCAMLGWNERRAACEQRAISTGVEIVQEIGCTDPAAKSGELVMFSGQIDVASLPELTLPGNEPWSQLTHQGTGIRVESAMYQCVEHQRTEKRKTSAGGEETITTYTYSREWKDEWVDSSRFQYTVGSHRNNCDTENPEWDDSIPRSGLETFAEEMMVGAFTTTMANKVPLKTPLSIESPDESWHETSTGSFYRGDPSVATIGDVKLHFYTNDPNSLRVTVLGKNSQGKIVRWIAPASWLCHGFGLSDLRMGTVGKEDLFKMLADESSSLTWLLRLLGFAGMWCAFSLCFGPLEVAADCIPCVGPCIGDAVATVTCCIACLPATACACGVAGLVWLVMRPLVGIPCMMVFLSITGGFCYFFATQRGKRRASQVSMTPEAFQKQTEMVPLAGAQMLAQPQVQMFQPQGQPQAQMLAPHAMMQAQGQPHMQAQAQMLPQVQPVMQAQGQPPVQAQAQMLPQVQPIMQAQGQPQVQAQAQMLPQVQPMQAMMQAAPGQPQMQAQAQMLPQMQAQPVLAQPVPAQRQLQVQVPIGSGPGQQIQFNTPEGNAMQATVPEGVQPGGYFVVTLSGW